MRIGLSLAGGCLRGGGPSPLLRACPFRSRLCPRAPGMFAGGAGSLDAVAPGRATGLAVKRQVMLAGAKRRPWGCGENAAGRDGTGGSGHMNKAAIVARVAKRMGLNKFTAERAVDTVLDAIAESLAKEEDVRIADFGTFWAKHRAARKGRHPGTVESVQIPASKIPSFKAAKGLREAVKWGWQPEAAEPADDSDGEPRNAGAMLEMTDWPGGVEPARTLLEPEGIEALRAEPAADKATLHLAADLPDETFGESAFARNALIALELIGNEFLPSLTEKGHSGRDTVASMRAAMT